MRIHPLLAPIPVLLASPVLAQKIDFETFPGGGVPGDKDDIHAQYTSLGVTFSLVRRCEVPGQRDNPRLCLPPTVIANSPKIAVVGGRFASAFRGVEVGGLGCADRPDPSANAGTRFLTDDATLGLKGNLLVSYLSPVEAAAGDLLDVDKRPNGAFEEWTVLALNERWDILDEVVIRAPSGQDALGHCPSGHGPGDGAAIPFVVESPRHVREIHHLLLAYTGGTGLVDDAGLAFDNFTPSANLCTGAWESLGAPCKGSAVLTASGCLVPGGRVSFEISGGLPNVHGCLLFSESGGPTPFGSCTAFLGNPLVFTAVHVLDGNGHYFREFALPPVLAAPEYFVQGVHMLPTGTSFTNGVHALSLP